jgi:hypothetical protein
MDALLVRRRLLTEPPAPFVCACGGQVGEWDPPDNIIATCKACGRTEYHLMRCEVTEDGLAREWIIGARGIVIGDQDSFEAQGFHFLQPHGARFFPDVPRFRGEVTHPDGSLKLVFEEADSLLWVTYSVEGAENKRVTFTRRGATPADDVVLLQVWGTDEAAALRQARAVVSAREDSPEKTNVMGQIDARLDALGRWANQE